MTTEETHPYPITQLPVVINVNDRSYPRTPKLSPAVSSFTVSPVRGFAPEQYDSEGLLQSVKFLEDKLRDPSIMDVYPEFQVQEETLTIVLLWNESSN